MAKGTLKIHSENILPIIKKWLYSDKDIFLRELVSNACDAISKTKVLREQNKCSATDEEFRIDILIDKENKTISISDTGIGMTKDEVKKYIAQLAFSGAEDFVNKYKSNDEKDQIIGHFGLGFYSSFMVSKEVTIDTLSYEEGSEAALWHSDGSNSYTLNKGKRETRGTSITLHIDDESEEYLDEEKIRQMLKKYSSYLPYPVYLGEEQINLNEPLWLKNASDCEDKDYIDFYRQLHPGEPDPIFWIHLNVDYPFNLKGILFFPKITRQFDFQSSNIKLFCNRVFVSDNCKDILPEYLTVLRGAIDSPDIPLNVSRSYLQVDKTVRQLASHISKKVSDRLTTLYQNDKEEFIKKWPDIEMIVKLGMLHDDKFYERTKNLLLWKTLANEWTTVEDYLERNKESHSNKIFYTVGEHQEAHLLDLYREQNIEVLHANGPLDSALFSHLERKLSDAKFQRVDGGVDDVILDKEKEKTILDDDGKTEAARISDLIKDHLDIEGVEVEAKSLSSDSVAGFVMIDEDGRRMRDYLAMSKQDLPADLLGKKTFVVNTNSPLIASVNHVNKKDPELSKALVHHIYELSLLAQKELLPTQIPSFINRSNEVLQKLAKHLADKES